jgi:threonyl-tRNA synthetase
MPDIRVSLESDESLGKRIRNAKNMRIPYQVVIGDQERDNGTVTVEGRNGYKEVMSKEDFMQKLQTEITERTLN